MNRTDIALEYKHMGFNCCQAVLMAFKEEMGLNDEQVISLGAGFGSGMGTTKGSCGALVGAVMADGMISGRKNSAGGRSILTEFELTSGAVTCGDLKGVKTGKVLCSCDQCVINAVKAAEKVLSRQ